MMTDLRSLMSRAHSTTRRLVRAGLSYRATLALVLRQLWSRLRRPLPPLVGRRRDVRRATALRHQWMPYYLREIEDAVLEHQETPGVFERGLALTLELFRPDARFWLEIAGDGFLGLDRLGEIVRERTAITNI